MVVQEQVIQDAIQQYQIPYLNQDPYTANTVNELRIEQGKVLLKLQLPFPAASIKDKISADLSSVIKAIAGVTAVTVEVTWAISAYKIPSGIPGIANVKNIIAVASGKGGVGKSTTAVNLAVALRLEGAQVGILDADIYGPNQPQMLGIHGHPEKTVNNKLQPLIAHGIQSMSIGYLIEQDDTPMVWRGPMVSMALQQLLNDTEWQDIDYLIVDLPPGTGDIQLTLSQKIPVSGAVIVTTPQDIALLDANKAIRMFEKVKIPVLGVIENMSVHVCTQCGHTEHIFGIEGATKIAQRYNIPVLGSLPLDIRIRSYADEGTPVVIALAESVMAKAYHEIALSMTATLALQQKNNKTPFPKIVIENK